MNDIQVVFLQSILLMKMFEICTKCSQIISSIELVYQCLLNNSQNWVKMKRDSIGWLQFSLK